MAGPRDILRFFRWLVSSERLPDDGGAEGRSRPAAWLSWLFAAEELGEPDGAELAAPAATGSQRRPGGLAWLFAPEELGETPAATEEPAPPSFLGDLLDSDTLSPIDSADATPLRAPRSLIVWLLASEDLDESPSRRGDDSQQER